MKRFSVVTAAILGLMLVSFVLARVDFEIQNFDSILFKDLARVQESCEAPASASFWCDTSGELTLITTKGMDYFFNDAGEAVALFAKQQNGQNFMTRDGGYKNALDSGQNLIPVGANVPSGAVLLNGDYSTPEVLSSNWEKTTATSDLGEIEVYVGTFELLIDGVEVDKTLRVSSVGHVLDAVVEATRVQAGAEDVTLQYATPGIAKNSSPVIKIGQGDTFSQNPVSTPVSDPSYISFQTNNSRGNSIVLRPREAGVSAQYLQNNLIALQSTLGADEGAGASLELSQYAGANELVRYTQQGYQELPGLFKPNIIGQISLGVLWVLERIHNVVGNWGLSIIVLTLIFRALIWPLISTQTKSMYAMQRLQPKLKEIQNKYKDDREKQTQATMELYKTEGVNPAGGCLPIVLQMPLFIILWRVFANFEFNEGFLWIPDLGQADPFYILPVLYVGVIFAQSYFMSQGNKQSLQQQILMNGVFIIFIINFPSGVTLYYVTSMLVQVFQYFLIQRERDKKPVLAVAGGGGAVVDTVAKPALSSSAEGKKTHKKPKRKKKKSK